MSDDITIADKNGNAKIIATDEVTYSGDTAHIQLARLVHVSGVEGSKTVSELVKAEDAPHASGDPGVQLFAVRKDTAVSLSGTDGDYTPLIVDENGRLHVQPVQTNNSLLQARVAGVDQHDDPAGTRPVQIAGRYSSSPAKVSDSGDLAALAVTQEGKILDIHSTAAADTTIANENYSSAQTNNQLVAAPGANKRLVVVEIVFSHDTAGTVKLVEDTAGTPADKWGPHYQPANGNIVVARTYIPLTANKDLGVTTTGTGNATISVRTIVENV